MRSERHFKERPGKRGQSTQARASRSARPGCALSPRGIQRRAGGCILNLECSQKLRSCGAASPRRRVAHVDRVRSRAVQSGVPGWIGSRPPRVRDVAFCTVLVAIAGVACGAADEDGLRARAAFDFDCPKDHIKIVELNADNTYGVIACGQRATYINMCHGPYDSECTWVQNTDSHRKHGDGDN